MCEQCWLREYINIPNASEGRFRAHLLTYNYLGVKPFIEMQHDTYKHKNSKTTTENKPQTATKQITKPRKPPKKRKSILSKKRIVRKNQKHPFSKESFNIAFRTMV